MIQRQRPYKISLFSQLLAGFTISLSIVGLATLWLNYHLVESSLEVEAREEAKTVARSLDFLNEGMHETGGVHSLQQVVKKYTALPEVMEVMVLDEKGGVLAHTDAEEQGKAYHSVHPELTHAIEQAIQTGTEGNHTMSMHGKPAIVYLTPIKSRVIGASKHPSLVVVVIDREFTRQKTQQIFWNFIAVVGLGILLILSVMGFLVQRTVLKPLNRLNQAILSSNSTGQFSFPVHLPNNEISFLAKTFDVIFCQQQQAEQVLQDKAEQLRSQNTILSALAKHRAVTQGNLKEAAQEITEATARLLKVERASVWLYDENKSSLYCVDLFEATPHRHSEGTVLKTAEYPIYFQAIDTENLISAHNAHQDPRTSEFSKPYLTPLNIHSMLDVPIRLKGQTVGVLCIEQVEVCRLWSAEDENFIRSISELFALAIEARDRTLAEQALKQSEMRNQALVNAQPDLLIRMLADGTYIDVVSGGNVQLLQPELMRPGVSIYDMLPLEMAEKRMQYVKQALVTKIVQIYEYSFEVNNQIRIEEARINACSNDEVLVIVRDITERKQAEQLLRQQAEDLESTLKELRHTQTQMIQSEKMSSLGQMVAGVAHEINNPVNFIYGNITHANKYVQDLLNLLELYERIYPIPALEIQAEIEAIDLEFLVDDLPKLLSSMKVGAERIREIVRSLRIFSRLDEAEFKTASIHEGIDSTLMILQHRLKANSNHPEIEIVKQYADIPQIDCYPGQLNQVFMNIISNAIDALTDYCQTNSLEYQDGIPQTYKPEIRIYTEFIDLSWIRIRIADNGSGIRQEMQPKLFDPFFTTKPMGKGTGLGLSISYQIVVERHSGKLYCYSELGKGAEFVIEIPVVQGSYKLA